MTFGFIPNPVYFFKELNILSKKIDFFCIKRSNFLKFKKPSKGKKLWGGIENLNEYEIQKKFKNGILNRNHFKRGNFLKVWTVLISFIGVFETSYLSFSKLKDSSILCTTQTCSFVLNSTFSEIFGVPLVFFGFFFYFGIFTIVLLDICKKNISKKNMYIQVALFYISGCLCNFSLFFVFLLEKTLVSSCQWCLLSIFLSGLIYFFQISVMSGRFIFNLNYFSKIIFLLNLTVFSIYCFNVIEISFLVS
mmetsp:Transcript_43489/g.103374  ORF Transcript_43489/g.103374 Transcript_43489/m.103374 type:complete len:249 (+) Transcript_43489:353-1099(+)